MRPIRGTRNIPNFQFPTFVLQRNHAEFRSGIALRKITDDFWSVRLDRWLRYIVVEKKKKKRGTDRTECKYFLIDIRGNEETSFREISYRSRTMIRV